MVTNRLLVLSIGASGATMLLLSSAASLFVCWLRNMMGFGSYISCITQLVDRGGMMCIGVIVSLLNNA